MTRSNLFLTPKEDQHLEFVPSALQVGVSPSLADPVSDTAKLYPAHTQSTLHATNAIISRFPLVALDQMTKQTQQTKQTR